MSSAPPLPFTAIEAEFRRLDRPPGPIVVDGRELAAPLPPGPIAPLELRELLRHPALTYEMQDAALGWVVRRAQEEGDRWMVAAVGMVLPGLCKRTAGLASCCSFRTADLQAEVLDGVLEAVHLVSPDRPRLAASLVWTGYRRGYRFVGHCRADAAYPPDQGALACLPPGNPDFVLQRAVAEGVIDEGEAAIIGDTRLSGVRLAELARTEGTSYQCLAKRRRRAELRLVAWLGAEVA